MDCEEKTVQESRDEEEILGVDDVVERETVKPVHQVHGQECRPLRYSCDDVWIRETARPNSVLQDVSSAVTPKQ